MSEPLWQRSAPQHWKSPFEQLWPALLHWPHEGTPLQSTPPPPSSQHENPVGQVQDAQLEPAPAHVLPVVVQMPLEQESPLQHGADAEQLAPEPPQLGGALQRPA